MDHRYLKALIHDFHAGSTDAFAALYLSTIDEQYSKAYAIARNIYPVEDYLHHFYTALYKEMVHIQTVHDYKSVMRRLEHLYLPSLPSASSGPRKAAMPGDLKEQQLLDVLAAVDAPALTHPLDVIADYNHYRSMKALLIRYIVILVCLVGLSLPFLFYVPGASTSYTVFHHRQAIQLTLNRHLFPIRSVTAAVDERALPIYERADGSYIIVTSGTEGTVTIRISSLSGHARILETAVSEESS